MRGIKVCGLMQEPDEETLGLYWFPYMKPTLLGVIGPGFLNQVPTLTYQNLLFCRAPLNSIVGFITRTYKTVGFESFYWALEYHTLILFS